MFQTYFEVFFSLLFEVSLWLEEPSLGAYGYLLFIPSNQLFSR